jgi:hypothetical protein
MAYSYVVFEGDAVEDTFTLTFPYIAKAHVTITVDDVNKTFTWPTTSTVTLDAVPANLSVIVITRTTPKDEREVDFTNVSLLDEETLDKDANQLFYIAQEAFDALANALQYAVGTGEYDADSKRIKNLDDGVSDDEAVNVGQIAALTDAAVAAAIAAQGAAETAQAAAETAQANAETAETNAETAETNAETAETNAETAETGAGVHEAKAADWAEEDEDVEVEAGEYSALHHSAKAAAAMATKMEILVGQTGEIPIMKADGDIESSELTPAGVGQLAVPAEWTKQQNINEAAITSSGAAVAWDTDLAQCALHTLTEHTTIGAPSNLNAGGHYTLRVVQAAGLFTLAFNAVFKWGEQDAPGEPAADGDVLILSFYSDGTNLYGVEAVREEA